jgi:hypothetical protein
MHTVRTEPKGAKRSRDTDQLTPAAAAANAVADGLPAPSSMADADECSGLPVDEAGAGSVAMADEAGGGVVACPSACVSTCLTTVSMWSDALSSSCMCSSYLRANHSIIKHAPFHADHVTIANWQHTATADNQPSAIS